MKRIFPLVLLSFIAFQSYSQRTANIAVSTGVVNYVGDLGHEKYFPYSSANIGSAITIRDFMNNPKRSGTRFAVLDMQLRFSWHRLQYDEVFPLGDKQGTELRNYMRGIGFRNDIYGSEVDFTYNIYPNRFAPLVKLRWSLFFSVGAGIFYGEPKADLFRGDASYENRYYYWKDGTIRNAEENTKRQGDVIEKDGEYETNLRNWLTEGQGYNREIHTKKPYSNWNIGIPFGGGVRYMYNKYLTFSAEVNYYYFLTDYLDDVSERYASNEELRASFPDPVNFELARYISDPSGHGNTGISTTSSRRGNPDHTDAFTYVSLEASYKITWKKKGIYGQ